jgi:O-antigen ligase
MGGVAWAGLFGSPDAWCAGVASTLGLVRRALVPPRTLPVTYLAVMIVCCVGLGSAVAVRPAYVPALLAITGLFVVLALPRPLEVLFLALLAGTVVLGKEFSAVPVGPVFVTEAGLGLLAAAVMVAERRGRLPPRVRGLFFAWMVCGSIAVALGVAADLYWVSRDAVLALYAVSLWLVAAVFWRAADAKRVLDVMFYAGIASTAAWAVGVRYPENAFNVYMALTYLPVLAAWLEGRQIEAWKWGVLAFQGYYLASLGVRASWIAFAVALVVLAFTKPPRLSRLAHIGGWAAIAAIVFVWLVLPQLPENSYVIRSIEGVRPSTDTVEATNSGWRLQFWDFYLDEIHNRPYGHGFGPPSRFCDSISGECWDTRETRDPLTRTAPHNSFLNIAYRMGVQALIVLALLCVACISPAIRRLRGGNDTLAIRAALASLAFVATTAFFSVSLEGPFMALPFWTLLGVLVVLGRHERPG